ncbi:DUF6178 family protein, partial [Myxococcota bacterium]|nr:DUF6178 family protein [Myxococcota bacterium]
PPPFKRMGDAAVHGLRARAAQLAVDGLMHVSGGVLQPVFYALIALANRIAVADRMELGDPESLPKAIDKATRLASDGLEYVATETSLTLLEALRRVPIERLFRVGANLDREAALPKPIHATEDDSEPDDGGEG